MKKLLLAVMLFLASCTATEKIDRVALIARNNPHVTEVDTLATLTVGNGGFAVSVDVTGLQSFPEFYSKGLPLGTQSDWGWHSFSNPENYRHEESLRDYDFGHGQIEPYATQPREGRGKDAADWYRMNPHRLHLGSIGFEGLNPADLTAIDQTLDMMDGAVRSSFTIEGEPVAVTTAVDPAADRFSATINSRKHLPIAIRFAYPTGVHTDDACNWAADEKHSTELVASTEQSATLLRTIDTVRYYVRLDWTGKAAISQKGRNHFTLTPAEDAWTLVAHYTPLKEKATGEQGDLLAIATDAKAFWNNFWMKGGVVDFSHCTDPRAKELERRVVLSQYLLAVQCAGDTPPQETGLTYNSWFGKFHLEMIYWHQAQFALYGHEDLLLRSLKWYHSAADVARQIAARQGFEGLRWMKMTDPTAMEAPSKTGSFLIWQQPHLIYLLELCYRANPSEELLQEYAQLVEETAT
ncbi:MAG: hypothetical protein IIW89_06580, partial [Alistipes sp.]|nr:hypothetical protein [Alistipes sp.]